ncbi:EAL domain-containing protein [[Enterobacter] lignolyticus]|uniref:cyclic-guanylate-specific phosphodiesterase n=1 Tax=Enterobacter lignolyticus (strain SCF1) TaxID=701347 RepID=E3G6T7_ENTLS|nr:EAL domain-containing protein [[Enterobacter] lignolyticus]ADO49582.1 EAL domain protein [[Enterobacter] lignolyticus SCF1]
MTSRRMVSLVIGVLILSVLLPVILSVWLAHYQAEKDFINDLNTYGERVIMRTKRVVDQAKTALVEIDAYQGTPCSEGHLKAMRQIVYVQRYVQEVIWLEGLKPMCSSMESKSSKIHFSPPTRSTHDGYRIWLTSENDLGIRHNMVALASKNHMVMIDPDSFVDVISFSSWAINVALIARDSEKIISENHDFDLALWRQAQREGDSSLIKNGNLYDFRDYPDLGISLVIWASTKPLTASWHRQTLIWLPVGLLVSLAGAWLIVRVLRRLQSPYYNLLDAINGRMIEVYYQPIVSLSTGKIVGAEALARWRQSDGTFLSPDMFVPLAEESGLITRLTQLIIEKAFDDLGPWLNCHPEQHISINLYPDDLTSPVLPALIASRLQQWNLSPSQIALELTERSMVDPKSSAQALDAYRKAGHAIYIDDFGTGYSSLSYLQDLDVDLIKIDKSFVDALEFKHLTSHIIGMAKALDLAIVAEGVETDYQREWLNRHGVQYGQGWFYSKALPKGDFINWAENNLRKT